MGLRALVFTRSHPALALATLILGVYGVTQLWAPGHSGPWLPFTPLGPFQMPRVGPGNVFCSLHHVFIALGLGEEAGLGLCF